MRRTPLSESAHCLASLSLALGVRTGSSSRLGHCPESLSSCRRVKFPRRDKIPKRHAGREAKRLRRAGHAGRVTHTVHTVPHTTLQSTLVRVRDRWLISTLADNSEDVQVRVLPCTPRRCSVLPCTAQSRGRAAFPLPLSLAAAFEPSGLDSQSAPPVHSLITGSCYFVDSGGEAIKERKAGRNAQPRDLSLKWVPPLLSRTGRHCEESSRCYCEYDCPRAHTRTGLCASHAGHAT